MPISTDSATLKARQDTAACRRSLSIELRDDAGELRQQAAVAALRGLAEGLKAESRPADPAPSLQAAE
ncbi:hypothetical protein [Methylorubrum extorquens]